MTEVIATDARKRLRFETSVAPTDAPNELTPKRGGHIDRRIEAAQAAKSKNVLVLTRPEGHFSGFRPIRPDSQNRYGFLTHETVCQDTDGVSGTGPQRVKIRSFFDACHDPRPTCF